MEQKNVEKSEKKRKKWLKKLERRSWQLELLVSGFSIILIVKCIDALGIYSNDLKMIHGSSVIFIGMAKIFVDLLILSCYALVVNLSIHLLFRGFWIGIVGLASVSPIMNFDKLKYSKLFTDRLKIRVLTIEKLVINIDNVCSLIFSFSFLVVFLLISLGFYILFTSVVIIFLNFIGSGMGVFIFSMIILFIVLISGLVYFLDFITLGFFKKYRVLSKIYFPIYWFYSKLTFSFLYRTIYYNLISRFPKKYIGLILFVYLAGFTIFPFIKYESQIYFPDDITKYSINNEFYHDIRNQDTYIETVSVPSRIISDKYFPLFIKYNVSDNETMKKLLPDFSPTKNEGLRSGIKFVEGGLSLNYPPYIEEESPEKILDCFEGLYLIYINDSIIEKPNFYFYIHHNKGEKGIISMIETKNLNRGHNILKITKKELKKDSIITNDFAYVPFWLE